MISEIRLINYKKFLCERIPLEPFTVFVGPNGSGKSTVASAIHGVATIMRLGLNAAFPEVFFSFDRLINHNAEKFGYKNAPMGFGISGGTDHFCWDYDILFCKEANSPSGFYIHYEGLKLRDGQSSFHCSSGEHPPIDPALPTKGGERNRIPRDSARDSLFIQTENGKDCSDPVLHDNLKKIMRYMQRFITYRFSPPSAIRKGCDRYFGDEHQPLLKPDGSNMAQVVQYLQENRKSLLPRFREWIAEYTEGEARIADVSVATYGDKVFLNFYEQGKQGRIFPVTEPLISDGLWVFAAMACLASCEVVPTAAFFEEPESHLHPHKLPLLYELFKAMVKREKNPCQILISTHSPYFLDLFKETPDSVILLNQGKAKRLSDIEDYEKILSLYTLGESWYSDVFTWGNP